MTGPFSRMPLTRKSCASCCQGTRGLVLRPRLFGDRYLRSPHLVIALSCDSALSRIVEVTSAPESVSTVSSVSHVRVHCILCQVSQVVTHSFHRSGPYGLRSLLLTMHFVLPWVASLCFSLPGRADLCFLTLPLVSRRDCCTVLVLVSCSIALVRRDVWH